MSRKKRRRTISKESFVDLGFNHVHSRRCDNCGSSRLTYFQESEGPTVIKNGQILCHRCRDLELPSLPRQLALKCEQNVCKLLAEETHPCRSGGVHVFCIQHHVQVHCDEEEFGIAGEFELEWAACLSGMRICSQCSKPASTDCMGRDGVMRLFCNLHHSCHTEKLIMRYT